MCRGASDLYGITVPDCGQWDSDEQSCFPVPEGTGDCGEST